MDGRLIVDMQKVNLITTTLLIRVHNCYFTVNRSKQFHIMELSILFYLNNSTNSRFFMSAVINSECKREISPQQCASLVQRNGLDFEREVEITN